jgi:O-antigen/teichoic acid export membrane protein
MHVVRGALFFAGPAVLANLTTAETIGAAELGLAVFFVASQFIELGTGPAIIQRPQLDRVFLSTVFWVNVATGLVFGGLLYAGAPFLANLLHLDPRFAYFLEWVAASILFFSLAIVQRSLLTRRLAFRRLAGVDAAAVVAAVAVASFPVLRVRVAEGLIAGLLAFAIVTCTGLWLLGRWLPSLSFDRKQLLPLFRFSLSISAARTLDNVSAQWERFLVAGLLSPADLGLYGLARNLHRTPLRHLMQVSDTVLMPALSTIQADKARCRSYYTTAMRLELAALSPALAFLAAFAPELVRLVYGQGWDRVVPLVYLTIPVTLRVITAHTVGAVFLSQGRADVRPGASGAWRRRSWCWVSSAGPSRT